LLAFVYVVLLVTLVLPRFGERSCVLVREEGNILPVLWIVGGVRPVKGAL
jgi:hypothetical protein